MELTDTDPNDAIAKYNTVLTDIVDKHAPLKTRTIVLRPKPPWFDKYLKGLKRRKGKAEMRMRRSKLHEDKSTYKSTLYKYLHSLTVQN